MHCANSNIVQSDESSRTKIVIIEHQYLCEHLLNWSDIRWVWRRGWLLHVRFPFSINYRLVVARITMYMTLNVACAPMWNWTSSSIDKTQVVKGPFKCTQRGGLTILTSGSNHYPETRIWHSPIGQYAIQHHKNKLASIITLIPTVGRSITDVTQRQKE